jgi:hypothetical protein
MPITNVWLTIEYNSAKPSRSMDAHAFSTIQKDVYDQTPYLEMLCLDVFQHPTRKVSFVFIHWCG